MTRPARIDRGALVGGGVFVVVTLFAWVGFVHEATSSYGMRAVGDVIFYVSAWSMMMAAMMLPSALPMLALYGSVARGPTAATLPGLPTALFALAYLGAWAATGVPVYVASLGVTHIVAGNASAARWLPYAVGAVLLMAAAYQFTPLKERCLRVCRSPLGFLIGHWRSGYLGALRMGWEHALYCIGCCWALMVVVVAVGAMALPWVLAMSVVIFVEKLLPYGWWSARIAGGVLAAMGVASAFHG